jgi:hypothetical protein
MIALELLWKTDLQISIQFHFLHCVFFVNASRTCMELLPLDVLRVILAELNLRE